MSTGRRHCSGHINNEEDGNKDRTHALNSGLTTLLNSRHANVPPGLKTRWASFRTAVMDVQFLIPNAIVYRSYESSLNLSAPRSCAFASWKAI
jgi:hypothetical protein